MGMTINRAVNHFIWKFKNSWKPTKTDADALNTIIEFVEQKHINQVNDHQLFAKLYIMVYAQFLDRYKATVFDDIPRKELTRYLDQPIEYIIERFVKRLNESELYGVLQEAGVEIKHPATKSKMQKSIESENIEELLKNDVNKDRFFERVWEYETVKDNLETQINQTIDLLIKGL